MNHAETLDKQPHTTPSMEVCEFLKPSDAQWSEFLARASSSDVYHLPEYSSVCAEEDGCEAVAVWYSGEHGEYLLPLLMKEVPLSFYQELGSQSNLSLKDAFSPYGYPGPLVRVNDTASVVQAKKLASAFQNALKRLLADSGVISLFVRFNPLLNPPGSFSPDYGALSTPTKTVYINLTSPKDQIARNMAKSHRWGIRRLAKLGHTTLVNDFNHLDDFICLYHATMDRVNAVNSYYFEREYFENMRNALGERFHLIMSFAPDGTPAAGGVFLEMDEIVQFHLSATNCAMRSIAPGKLVVDTAIDWFQSRGRRYLHMGGGVGGHEDSLYTYKSRYSPHRASYYMWKAVVNEDLFCRAMKTPHVEDSHLSGFFPPYRSQRWLLEMICKQTCTNCTERSSGFCLPPNLEA